MPLYRLRSGILDTNDPIPVFLAAFVTPLAGPFSPGAHVVSPRAPTETLVVITAGGVDFGGTQAYFCRSLTTPDSANWYAETDLVNA